MGSGKTTVGRLVASRLGYRFLDLDTLIVENAGKNIREIFDEDGEEVFRQIETDALYSLREMHRLVIATGGAANVIKDDCDFVDSWVANLPVRGVVLAYKKFVEEKIE